jgi:hypothetical protein
MWRKAEDGSTCVADSLVGVPAVLDPLVLASTDCLLLAA